MDKGAHFYRCDFQVHTPRDRQWHGSDCLTPDDRDAYAATLVAACRSKGLGAIAVTDHHDMAFISQIRKAAREETDGEGNPLQDGERLVVFPGMELTLAVPCQAILILDADFEDNRFDAVMTALTIYPAPDTDAKTIETLRLNSIQSISVLKQKLDEHSWLKDRFIIFPNVSGEGKSSLLRNGMMAKYKEMPCVGGYVDGSLSGLKAGSLSILSGKDKAWGHKRIACIQTSDNRQADHGKLGEHSSWIKWARPTAEALRQACLAQESRITHETPAFPAAVINSVSVSNSSFLGPIDLHFNPQYNALIGGRGTGKSTILEYVRWVLCDQPPATEDDTAPNYQIRRSRLIDNTLKPLSATVDVSFSLNSVAHVVRRDSKTGNLMMKVGSDEMRPCSEAEVRTLLPIQAYSQKQLSDVSVRVDELCRFVTAPVRSELALIERKIQERAEKLRQSYASRRRQQTLTTEISKRNLEARSLEEQAEAIRKSLTGLSEDDRELLGRGKGYDVAEQSVESWSEDLRALGDGAAELSELVQSNLDDAAVPVDAAEGEILQRVLADYRLLMTTAKASLDAIVQAASKITEADAATGGPWRQWQERLGSFRTAYDAAVQRSSAHRERMEQLKQIEMKLSAQQKETTRINEELKSLKSAGTAYAEERRLWHEARAERDALMDGQCQLLTQSSGGSVRARVQRHANAEEFVERFRETMSGASLRRERGEALGTAITEAEDPEEYWGLILSELETLAVFDPGDEGAERRPSTPTLASAAMSPGDLDKIARKLSPESWLGLSLVEIGSEPVFEYKARDNDYIPFGNASAGQQATALLKTLLNQVGPPLLIDQPEEDLDNPVMQEIVEQIWGAKQNRQIIFVSHNANLVVNGDAELVVWCEYRKSGDQSWGKIAGEGAIDVPVVRDAIKKIMEGGEAAFNLRREKYGF